MASHSRDVKSSRPGRPRLEAKFYGLDLVLGLIVVGLGLVLGLMSCGLILMHLDLDNTQVDDNYKLSTSFSVLSFSS